MSKNCIISLIIGCFVYSLLSCSESYPYCEDEYDKTWISVYPSSITIDKDELAGSFSVSSNRKWTIYSEPYWLYLSTYSGDGNKSIDFTVSENTGYSNRSGNILIRTEDGAIKEQSIYITQAPTTPFSVTMNTTSYGAYGDWQTMSITAASSKSWTISKTHSWVHLGSTSSTSYSYNGTGSGNVKIYVDENTSSYSRSSTLTVKCGTNTKEITITQEAPTPFEVTMNTTNYKADGDWWYMSITAASSQSWNISKTHSWVHLGSSSSTSYTYYGTGNESVQIYVDANTSSYSRSSTLTVKCGTNTKEITITQDGKSNNAPFVITGVDVRNVDKNSNVITDFGETIYSYQTKYLQPRLNIIVNTSGSYTIYAKLFRPDGTMSSGSSSPTGYTFSYTKTLYSYTTSWILSGWGNNTAGHWSSGQYRWEFWYNGAKIGEKSFTIY